MPAGYDPNGGTTFTRLNAALYDRRFAEAARVLAAGQAADFCRFQRRPRVPGVAGGAGRPRRRGSPTGRARRLLTARTALEDQARGQPEDAATLSRLGRIDAGARLQGAGVAGRAARGRTAAGQRGRDERRGRGKRAGVDLRVDRGTGPGTAAARAVEHDAGRARTTASCAWTRRGTRCAATGGSSSWWGAMEPE